MPSKLSKYRLLMLAILVSLGSRNCVDASQPLSVTAQQLCFFEEAEFRWTAKVRNATSSTVHWRLAHKSTVIDSGTAHLTAQADHKLMELRLVAPKLKSSEPLELELHVLFTGDTVNQLQQWPISIFPTNPFSSRIAWFKKQAVSIYDQKQELTGFLESHSLEFRDLSNLSQINNTYRTVICMAGETPSKQTPTAIFRLVESGKNVILVGKSSQILHMHKHPATCFVGSTAQEFCQLLPGENLLSRFQSPAVEQNANIRFSTYTTASGIELHFSPEKPWTWGILRFTNLNSTRNNVSHLIILDDLILRDWKNSPLAGQLLCRVLEYIEDK